MRFSLSHESRPVPVKLPEKVFSIRISFLRTAISGWSSHPGTPVFKDGKIPRDGPMPYYGNRNPAIPGRIHRRKNVLKTARRIGHRQSAGKIFILDVDDQQRVSLICLPFANGEFAREVFFFYPPGLLYQSLKPDLFYPAEVVDLYIMRVTRGPVRNRRKIGAREIVAVAAKFHCFGLYASEGRASCCRHPLQGSTDPFGIFSIEEIFAARSSVRLLS